MESHILLGLLIPVVFIGFTGLVKTLVKKRLMWSNFYLGIDSSLAALANAVVNIVDHVHEADGSSLGPHFGSQMFYTASWIVVSIGCLFVVMAIHQQFEVFDENENPDDNRGRRGVWLGAVSNLLGGFVLGVYIYLKLRGIV